MTARYTLAAFGLANSYWNCTVHICDAGYFSAALVLIHAVHICVLKGVGWQLTTKLEPKLVMVAMAEAGPLTANGKISPTMSQLIGPKLTCIAPSKSFQYLLQ